MNKPPSLGLSKPTKIFKKVLLPEPFFPKIPIIWFFLIVKFKLCKIFSLFSKYSNEIFFNSILS